MRFRYVLTGEYTEQPTVYQMYFGKKYYIWKCKNLEHSLQTISKDIHRFAAKGCPADSPLTKVIDHITRARVLFFRVEVLLQTDNVTQLIEFENLTLQKSKEDPLCLNVKFEAYIPKWIADHGQTENKEAQNKPLRATISPSSVSKHQSIPKIKPVNTRATSNGNLSLMDALEKLNK